MKCSNTNSHKNAGLLNVPYCHFYYILSCPSRSTDYSPGSRTPNPRPIDGQNISILSAENAAK